MSRIVQGLSKQDYIDIDLAFSLFKEDPDQFCLPKDTFLKAFELFLSLYEPITKSLKEEKQLAIQKAYPSQLNFNYFQEIVKQIKVSNRGIFKKETHKLNNNYIMKHLSENNIINIDVCWGKFDKNKLGYILYHDIRSCVDLILSNYNTTKLDYIPYSYIEEQQTISSPVTKGNNQQGFDTVIDEKNISKQSTQKGEFQLQQEKQLEQAKTMSEPQRVNTESKNQVDEWIFSFEGIGFVSFERFANFIACIIVENNLKQKSLKTACQCNIF